jgi:hypothetical protein
MNSRTNDFVDSYCLDDNKMRAVVTLVLTVMIFTTAAMLSNASNSFRTCRLSDGINEGVFVAITSGLTYRIKSIRRRGLGLIILIIVFIEFTPELWQSVSSIAITTEKVFTKTHAKVETYSGRINYGLGVDYTEMLQIANPPGGLSNGDISAATATYGNPELSVVKSDKIVTNVVREGLALNITAAEKKSDYSFPFIDVVATVSSNCSVQLQERVSFLDNENAYIKVMMDGTGAASKFDSTYTTDTDTVIFENTKIVVYCENNSCNITSSLCTSDVTLSRSSFIYTPSNKKVTITRTIDKDVTISIRAFADLVNGLVGVPEYLALKYGISLDATSATTNLAGLSFTRNAILSSRTIGVGLFDGIAQNELHATVCASAALTLSDLQATSFVAAGNFSVDFNDIYRALYGNTTNNNLYLPVNQAYMPTYFAAILFAFFVILSFLLMTVDLVSFRKSLINIKNANELAFIDNIGYTMASKRLRHSLSNDASEQERVAFENTLYCRQGKNSNGDAVIYIEYDGNVGPKPDVNVAYH